MKLRPRASRTNSPHVSDAGGAFAQRTSDNSDHAGPWSELRLAMEYVALAELKPATRNVRKHPREQIEQLERIIQECGTLVPLVVDDDLNIKAGNARWHALKNRGFTHAPIIRAGHLSAEQLRLFALADNRIPEKGSWDENILRIEIADLIAHELDLSIAGFEAPDIDRLLLPSEFSLDDDVAPIAPPSLAVARSGDLWTLGRHRLLCGDALSEAAFERLMNGERANASFNDPPFNVPVAGHISVANKAKHREFAMASGEMDDDQYELFLRTWFRHLASWSKDGSLHFICQDWRSFEAICRAGRQAFSELKNVIVWDKTNAGMGSLYRSRHEHIFLFKVGKGRHTNNVQLGKHGRNRGNVWCYPGANAFGKGREKALADHPTVKPIALVSDALLDVTNPNDLVIDAFAGSGATLLAAERTGRRCRAIEIEPAYVDVIIARWQHMTGQQATLDGVAFEQVRAERIGGANP